MRYCMGNYTNLILLSITSKIFIALITYSDRIIYELA